jgi:hypothetical protein
MLEIHQLRVSETGRRLVELRSRARRKLTSGREETQNYVTVRLLARSDARKMLVLT